MQRYDVVILGAGTAGLAAWRAASGAGKRVAMVDPGPLGTTCARVGCMPSKLLIAAAHAARDARDAHHFGADIAREPEVDGAAVFERVRTERDRFVGFTLDAYDAIPEEHFYRAPGVFRQDGRVQVGDQTLEARAYVVAVGSRPRTLPFLHTSGVDIHTSDDVFEWTEVPKRVAFFGPGVVGLELGLALAHLGADVHIFGKNNLIGPLSDPQVKQAAVDAAQRYLHLDIDSEVQSVEPTEDGKARITYLLNGRTVSQVFDRIVETVGRVSNTDRVFLDRLTPHDLTDVNPETGQLGSSNVFVAGDASNDRPLLHEAADAGRIAGLNAAHWPTVASFKRRSLLGIVFTDPDIAMVGDRFIDLDLDHVAVGRVSFGDQGRARSELRNAGRLHVYASKESGRFLGAELVAPDGEHLAHLLAWAHQQQLTIGEILAFPFYHPVVEEGVRTALRDAQHQINQSQQQRLTLEAS